VIQFTFEFYGYKTYNAIINPNNEIVRTVLGTMIKSGDYFFFAVNPNGSVTTFRSELEEENLVGLKSNFYRINYSSTTDAQYRRALISFKKKPYPEGTLLNWVCRDDIEYLDLSKNRYELSPAAVGSV
jgi:HKD family nuclease